VTARRVVAWVLAPLVVLGAVIAFAVASRGSNDVALPEGTVTSFEVPPGTAAALRRGESVDEVFPRALTLQVGDWLELVNADDETHRLGPVVARAGETVRVRFYEAGRFDAECSVGHDRVLIEVLAR
jgi:hypothetical protein